MSILRWVWFLVMERSKKLTLLLDSRVGLSWMQLWIVSMYSTLTNPDEISKQNNDESNGSRSYT